jgi:hypothetical protein
MLCIALCLLSIYRVRDRGQTKLDIQLQNFLLMIPVCTIVLNQKYPQRSTTPQSPADITITRQIHINIPLRNQQLPP